MDSRGSATPAVRRLSFRKPQPERICSSTVPPARKSASAEQQGPTAVESAIALSDKYAKLSEEAAALRQNKQTLEAENQQLKDDLQNCRTQSEQTQKELTQANDLLLQTRLELNNWKNDVLGFRGEMRDAEKAQLETLFKILKLMGGEVNQPGNTQTQDSKEQKCRILQF